MYAKVIILGRLGAVKEIQSSAGYFLKYSIAVDKVWKDKAGDWQKKTSWLQVVCYNPTEARASYKPGTVLFIEAKIEQAGKYTNLIAEKIIPINQKKEALPETPPQDNPFDEPTEETQKAWGNAEPENKEDLPEWML